MLCCLLGGLQGCSISGHSSHEALREGQSKLQFGSTCFWDVDGEYGQCPATHSDLVGAHCVCATIDGQQNGHIIP